MFNLLFTEDSQWFYRGWPRSFVVRDSLCEHLQSSNLFFSFLFFSSSYLHKDSTSCLCSRKICWHNHHDKFMPALPKQCSTEPNAMRGGTAVTLFYCSNVWRNRCWAFVLSAGSPRWIGNHKPQITLHWSRETVLVFSFCSATCTLTCMFVGLNNEISGNEEFSLCPSLVFRAGDLYLGGLGWCGKTGRKANHPDLGSCTIFLHRVNFCSEFNTTKIKHKPRNGRWSQQVQIPLA